jgi:DNA-binding transcriptional regulator GbsR (MarR family)
MVTAASSAACSTSVVRYVQYTLNEGWIEVATDARCQAFVDRLGSHAEADGLPRIACRLFGTLLLSPEPRSLDDLAEELGVSKASVSTDCRRLLERGMVERVSRPGDRRDFYQPTPDFFDEIIRQSIRRWSAMRDLAGALRAAAPDAAPVVRARLDYIDAAHGFVCGRLEASLREWQDGRRWEPATATVGATVPA